MAAIEPAAQLLKPPPSGCDGILSAEAIGFLTALARRFEPTRQELLQRRQQRQQEIDAGRLPDFLPTTHDIREREWTVAPIPPDLLDRRGGVTGALRPEVVVNAV